MAFILTHFGYHFTSFWSSLVRILPIIYHNFAIVLPHYIIIFVIFIWFWCNFAINCHGTSIVLLFFPEILNLNLIIELKRKFRCKIGYSGHETSVSPSIAAWFLGADYIERHITLDRTMYGTDQAASLSEAGIRELTSMLSKFPTMFGSGKKTISQEEKKLIPKFKYW